jgi:hypothetical protein
MKSNNPVAGVGAGFGQEEVGAARNADEKYII